jgi:rhodanese-related sulfurtransferase
MPSYRNHPANDYTSVVDPDTQFVDVRQPTEVAEQGIAGARNIPLDQLAERLTELDPNRRTVVLCRSGGRSAQAADFLAGVGFVDVVNLRGGILKFSEGAQR